MQSAWYDVCVNVCVRVYQSGCVRASALTISNANVCIFPSIFIHFRRRHQYIDIGIHIGAHSHTWIALPNKKKNVKRNREETKSNVFGGPMKKCGNIKRIEPFFSSVANLANRLILL